MTKLKPIETKYNGLLFRSRLEARWAIFFDSLGLCYDYEPEGFDLGEHSYYLPDFWLPDIETWIEIKPRGWWGDRDKYDALQEASGHRVVILAGSPGIIVDPYDSRNSYTGLVPCDQPYFWCQCWYCGNFGIEFDAWAGRIKHKPDCPNKDGGDRDPGLYSPALHSAYKKARSARFEFGDAPRTIYDD